jgi:geranylgeranyl diphosphate synthase, type I
VVSTERRLAELGRAVDEWTHQALADATTAPAARFAALLEYHLGWRDERLRPLATPAPSGKKLRPGLVLLVSEAVGADLTTARDAAVAVELVHNFSLVHDDVQDGSRLRRHRPTLWALWGVEQAINAGDALFALAQAVCVRGRSAASAAQAAELADACLRLAEGQYLDIDLQTAVDEVSLDLYAAMIERKTGALFACACRLGAMAGGADPERCDAFAAYGLELGVAFQEQDDVLGVWGAEAETGKPAAADVAARKRGLPAVLALARPDAPPWLQAAYAPARAPMRPALVQQVIEHLEATGVREEAERQVEARYAAARRWLDTARPEEPAATHLRAICDLLRLRRT